MRRDPSGWTTRLDEAMIERFSGDGRWSGITLVDCARDRALREPDNIAVVDGPFTATFAEVWTRSVRLCASLRRRGLVPGDVISFQLPNWHETMVINLAASLGGFVANPIVPIYRDSEVGFILADARSSILFVTDRFRSFDYIEMVDRLRPQLPHLKHVVLVRAEARPGYECYDDWLAETREAFEPAQIDSNSIKLLLYTSGTTGLPKGVLHSHNTLRAEGEAWMGFWRLQSDDVVLMASPVTHITGYVIALELAFSVGMKAVLMERWDADAAVPLVLQQHATFTVSATPFLRELVDATERQGRTLPSFRLFACGGSPVPPEIIRRAARALPNCRAVRVYGSSEAPTVSLGAGLDDPIELGATTDGRIVNHDVRIVDAVTGVPVADGMDGEILTRGPEVMLGYTDPEETETAFDPDGYFRTGDLGFRSHGDFLTISGRKKDLIIRGGENISPREIEDLLHRHPAILEAAVVAMPHIRLGETPMAWVVLRKGHTLNLDQLIAFLEGARLARQKFPERLEIVSELPRTATGKILKHVLRLRSQHL